MSGALTIQIESRPLDQIEAELVVVGSFRDERPLRGDAGRADWRLCGLVSDLLGSGRLSGKRGDVLLTPSFGRIRAPHVLWLGLGDRARYRPGSLRKISGEAVLRAVDLGVRSVAMAPLGVAPDDFPRHAEALVGGLALGARAVDHRLRLRLCLPREAAEGALRALERVAEAPGLRDLTLVLVPLPRDAPAGRTADARRAPSTPILHRY